MSERRHSIRKKAMWVVATIVVMAIVAVAVVELFAAPPLEARVEQVMVSHGFIVPGVAPLPPSADTRYTDFRAEGMNSSSLEKLVAELEALVLPDERRRINIDNGFSLFYEPEGTSDTLALSVVAHNEVDGKWQNVNAVMVSKHSGPGSLWQRLLDLWPF